MRVIGLDLGAARIGVAVSDISRLIASPHSHLPVTKAQTAEQVLLDTLPQLLTETSADTIVVGLPLQLDGQAGSQAQKARAVADKLAAELEASVVLHDERHTTTIADMTLKQSSLSGPKRRRIIDQVAAAVMLQSWLDLQGQGQRQETDNSGGHG